MRHNSNPADNDESAANQSEEYERFEEYEPDDVDYKDLFGEDDEEINEYEAYDELDEYYEAPRTSKAKPKRQSKNLLPGVVVRARGHHFDVQVVDADDVSPNEVGNVYVCEVRGRMLQERGRDTLVAVGDRVSFVQDGKKHGRIESVGDRDSVLSRQHPGVSVPAEDVILANPDQVLAVFAAAQPDPHLRMVDRFLVIAEANEIPAIICANKIDINGLDAAREIFGLYEEIGYKVVYTSVPERQGISELKEVLSDSITVLSGPSGVGKSSLLNAIQPALNIHVGDLREALDKGKHTTRAARMYSLPFGKYTFVADTPGIRELGLYDIDPQDLGFYYIEFVPYIHDCRYPNCTHDHEPACAVRAAVERGDISRIRYDSYLRLLHSEGAAETDEYSS